MIYIMFWILTIQIILLQFVAVTKETAIRKNFQNAGKMNEAIVYKIMVGHDYTDYEKRNYDDSLRPSRRQDTTDTTDSYYPENYYGDDYHNHHHDYHNHHHDYDEELKPASRNSRKEINERSDLIFKVQRDPEGKLNVVFNDSINLSKNTETYPIPSNPIRRSTGSSNARIYPTPPTSSQRQKDIIFPDDLVKSSTPNTPIPVCSKLENTFCTEVENYPMHAVETEIFTNADKFTPLFGDDVVVTVAPNISERIDGPGEESLCISSEKLIYPQAGLTKDNNWSFIVNQQNFTQGIRIEECVNVGKPCAMSDLFPNGYTTECKQGYIYRQLLSVNPDGKIAKDLFRIPSCCKCIIKTHRFKRSTHKTSARKN